MIVVQQVAYAIISALAIVFVMLAFTYFVIHIRKEEIGTIREANRPLGSSSNTSTQRVAKGSREARIRKQQGC